MTHFCARIPKPDVSNLGLVCSQVEQTTMTIVRREFGIDLSESCLRYNQLYTDFSGATHLSSSVSYRIVKEKAKNPDDLLHYDVGSKNLQTLCVILWFPVRIWCDKGFVSKFTHKYTYTQPYRVSEKPLRDFKYSYGKTSFKFLERNMYFKSDTYWVLFTSTMV